MDAIQRTGLTWTEENDLRWYFARDYESPLGLRSSMHGQLQKLKLGRGSGESSAQPGEVSEETFHNARRLNRLIARLRPVPPELQPVLRALFGPEPTTGLDIWGELAPIVPFTTGAAAAHRHSRSERPLVEWLQRLSQRVREQKGHQRLRDARLVAELRLEAEELLSQAVESFRRGATRRAA